MMDDLDRDKNSDHNHTFATHDTCNTYCGALIAVAQARRITAFTNRKKMGPDDHHAAGFASKMSIAIKRKLPPEKIISMKLLYIFS